MNGCRTKLIVEGQAGAINIFTVGQKTYGDNIICLAGEDESQGVSKQHKVIDGIGDFEKFNRSA